VMVTLMGITYALRGKLLKGGAVLFEKTGSRISFHMSQIQSLLWRITIEMVVMMSITRPSAIVNTLVEFDISRSTSDKLLN
jgi:hypothetical protein